MSEERTNKNSINFVSGVNFDFAIVSDSQFNIGNAVSDKYSLITWIISGVARISAP
jgi:hypothetical protein